jgi:glycosyltransferase involved in cell wall biosynthesis
VKIAVVAPTSIPARRANTLQVMKMCQALVELGHEVRLAAPSVEPGAPRPEWEALARHYGLRHPFPVDWLRADPRLRRYDYGWQAVRWARGWGAGLLYTRLPQAAALGSALGLPTIFEAHDFPAAGMGVFLFQRFLKGRGRRRLVVITRALAQDLEVRLGSPAAGSAEAGAFTVIAPDGVDLERYADLPSPEEARKTLPLGLGGFTAGYTGHLYAGRGVELILELAARLPGVNFMLVGGEPADVARWEGHCQQRGLKNVCLAGFIPNADLPRYQAACDVLLMPYQAQVAASSGGNIARYLSPMKLFEYLACGRPVLSGDLPVLREVLSPQNALLLPSGEAEVWATAILALQGDPTWRAALGEQARRSAAGYSWTARAGRILAGLMV